MITLANLGFPRIGKDRELKFALEKYWRKEISLAMLRETAAQIRKNNWELQRTAGIDQIPCGDFSFYDHVLDHLYMFGAIPPRFKELHFDHGEDLYFSLARGFQQPNGQPVAAMEMTKWFNTNYHYIVPEIEPETHFSLDPQKLLQEIEHAATLGIHARPVLLGPVSFLLLSKSSRSGFDPLEKLSELLPVYENLLSTLRDASVRWIQLDEPFLSADLTPQARAAFKTMFTSLGGLAARPKVILTAYFADLQLNNDLVHQSPFEGLHIDLIQTQDPQKLAAGLKGLEVLSLGLINGRNIWREDMQKTASLASAVMESGSAQNYQFAPSCSLLHLPYDVEREDEIDPQVRYWMAFAQQKLEILACLGRMIKDGQSQDPFFLHNQEILADRASSPFVHSPEKMPTLADISPSDMARRSVFPERKKLQNAALNLPLLPTTTIGSFPQTAAVRKARADMGKGTISMSEYESFVKEEIKRTVQFQETIGLDVLVHGEFERNDMVQ